MPTIWIRPDTGKRYILWLENGRYRRSLVPSNTDKEAKKPLVEIERKMALVKAGLQDVHASRVGQRKRFDKWVQEYLAGQAKVHTPRTQRLYQDLVNLHLEPFSGKTPLAHIDSLMVQDFQKTLRAKKQAPPTVNRNLVMLRPLLAFRSTYPDPRLKNNKNNDDGPPTFVIFML